MKKVVVLLADGCEEIEAITVIDLLRRAQIDVTCAGVTGRDVVGGHSVRIATDITVDEIGLDFDGVVIPGGTGGAQQIAANSDAMHLIGELDRTGKLVAAICAAPGVVLGSHGLIGERSYTCYPGFEKMVESGTFGEDRVVIDTNLITSRGPGTSAEFALSIISYLVGEETAATIRDQTLQP
jgi:4-methyl-5(b-hydroxyethyl)-thiazole monophosphate biosynthesis